ncbi:MAG: type 2 lanthipeptide synthetase LanM [Pseudomonadota bacterium]
MNVRDLVKAPDEIRKSIIKLAAEAAPLHERHVYPDDRSCDSKIDPIAMERMAHWRQISCNGNSGKWENRLLTIGYSEKQLNYVLGSKFELQEAPDWVGLFLEAYNAVSNHTVADLRHRLRFVQANADLKSTIERNCAYEELLLPFVFAAWNELKDEAQLRDLLSGDAEKSLKRQLLLELEKLTWRVLHTEFSIYREMHHGFGLHRIFGRTDTGGRAYGAFIEYCYEGGWYKIFQSYPVLARLISFRCRQWKKTTLEFLGRIYHDKDDICEAFHVGFENNDYLINELECGLSDPHDGGRSVIAVTLCDGTRIIYKPRDISLEASWFKFLAWVGVNFPNLSQRNLKCLVCDEYGWVESVGQKQVRDHTFAVNYFSKVGNLLAFLHVLEGTDFHSDNLIANGEFPVLIDLEMLFYPKLNIFKKDGPDFQVFNEEELISNTVIRCGLLPSSYVPEEGMNGGISGIAAVPDPVFREVAALEKIGSDAMKVASKLQLVSNQKNQLLMDDTVLNPSDFVECICDGFEEAFKAILQIREKFGTNNILSFFSPNLVRVLVRPTEYYEHLQQYALDPKFLKNGADRSIELDRVTETVSDFDAKTQAWDTVNAEHRSLEDLDIPIFHAHTEENWLLALKNRKLDNCFNEPAVDIVRRRLDDLQLADCANQLAVIRSAFKISNPAYNVLPRSGGNIGNTIQKKNLSFDPLKHAVEIGELFQTTAIKNLSNSVAWLALSQTPILGMQRMVQVNYGLYDGSAGISVFLAQLAKMTGRQGIRKTAYDAIEPVRALVNDENLKDTIVKQIGIGAAAGIGSYIYSLLRAGHALDDSNLIKDAEVAMKLVDESVIAEETKFEFLYGISGLLLSLLALHSATGSKDAIQLADCCGARILQGWEERPFENIGWKNALDSSHSGAGFSHGNAGVILSLSRLWEITKNKVYLDVAKMAADHEINAVQSNSDLRAHQTMAHGNNSLCSWCNGITGVGIGRLADPQLSENEEFRQTVDVALSRTLETGLSEYDQLCCGSMGRIEFLMQASIRLDERKYMETALSWLERVVSKSRSGGYTFTEKAGGHYWVPGLFTGEAGVGYQLLRACDPFETPSLLSWEI